MYLLELIIQKKIDQTWPVVAMQTATGSFLPIRSEGQLALDLDELSSCSRPLDYGRLLGCAMFQGDIDAAFTRALTDARHAGETLRVLLTVEDQGLRALHWERLCAPLDDHSRQGCEQQAAPASKKPKDGRPNFLMLNQEVSFSLYLPSLTDQRFTPIGRTDLRALVLVAGNEHFQGGYSLGKFSITASVNGVLRSLGKIPCDVLSSVDVEDEKPTLDNLCKRIATGKYSLLHIICHGQFNANSGDTFLYFPGDRGVYVRGEQLIERLRLASGTRGLPHFIYLNACASGDPEAENGMGGLGQRLVRELGVPAVLAMTAPISIDTADKLAGDFYQNLYKHGEPDRALTQSLAGIMTKYDVTVPAIFSRLGGRPLFSDALDRPLTPLEIEHGLYCLEEQVALRSPVLSGKVRELATRLRAYLDVTGLVPAALKEREQAVQEINELTEEICEISFNALATDRPLPPYDPTCPFRGLSAFRHEDQKFFFGRDTLVQTLVTRLAEHPFLIVSGASGSGKSSLVQAGLIPALAIKDLAYLTPSDQPLERLSSALSIMPKDALVLVDQFEELFTLCADEKERVQFVDRLADLSKERRVVLTMRADFFDECAAYPRLKQLVQTRTELIAPMDAAELRRAVEQQAASAGLRFESGLVATILDEVKSEPGAMPLLQHALLLLWQRRHGRWLRIDDFKEIGGVKEAISRTADEIYLGLDENDRERMRAIFLRLTRLGDEDQAGTEHRDTRRRVSMQEIIPAGQDSKPIEALVNQLASARLVMTSTNPVSGQTEVEVAHEALIRHWERLREWLDENRAALRLGSRIRDAAQEWQQSNRDASLLVHYGGRLAEALGLRASGHYGYNQLEIDYLDACRDQQEKARLEKEQQQKVRAQLQRTILVGSIVAAIVMLILSIYSINQAGVAQVQSNYAGTQAAVAENQRSTAYAASTQAVMQQITAVAAQDLAKAESERAQQQAEISLARLMNSLSGETLSTDPSDLRTAGLLAIESLQRYPEASNNEALREVLSLLPVTLATVTAPMPEEDGSQMPVAYTSIGASMSTLSPAGNLAAISTGNSVIVWDLETGQTVELPHDSNDVITLGVFFNMDSTRLVSVGYQTIMIWDISADVSFENEKSYTYENNSPVDVVFDQAGRLVVLYSEIYTSQEAEPPTRYTVYNIDTDAAWNLEIESGSYAGFNADGTALYVDDSSGAITTYDMTGAKIEPTLSHNGPVNDIITSQDGRWVLLYGDALSPTIYEANTGQAVRPPNLPSNLSAAVFSPSGDLLAVGSIDGTIKVWDMLNSKELATMKHSSTVLSIAFSSAENQIVSRGSEGTTRVWDVHSGREQARMADSAQDYSTPIFFPDSQRILSTVMGIATVWMPRRPAEIQTVTYQDIYGYDLGISRDGSRVAVSGNSDVYGENSTSTTIVYNWETNKPLFSIDCADADAFLENDFSPDGRHLAVLCGTRLSIYDALGGDLVREYTNRDGVQGIIYSGNSQYLGFFDESSQLVVWEPEAGRIVFRTQGSDPACDVELDLNGQKFDLCESESKDSISAFAFEQNGVRAAYAVGDDLSTIHQVNLATGEDSELQTLKQGYVYNMAYTPDGTQLAAIVEEGDSGGYIAFLDTTSGAELDRLELNTFNYSLLDFSPDGRYLVLGSESSQPSEVIDLSLRRVVSRFSIPGEGYGMITALEFSPDGRYLRMAIDSNQVFVWSWNNDDLIARACESIGGNLFEAEWKELFGAELPYHQTCK